MYVICIYTPPTQERGSGGYPPGRLSAPPSRGELFPLGGPEPSPLSRFLAIHWHLYVSFYLLSYYSSYLLPS